MFKNNFGEISNNELRIFSFPYDRKFKRKNVRHMFLFSVRKLHYNLLAFLFAIYVLLFLNYLDVLIFFIFIILLIFSFFFRKISYKCIIVEQMSIVVIKVKLKDINDAKLIIDTFNYLSPD